MLEKTVVSYGYIPENKVMLTSNKSGLHHPSHEAIIKYSQFEESYLANTANNNNNNNNNKSNAKKNVRRRAESRKAMRCSDAESDTSDGFTVNSGGSGRSGDWGPPKCRQKPKYSRRRQEQRASFTDSGISLTKTDSGDLSEFSYQERFFLHRPSDMYSDSSHERCSRISKQNVQRVQKPRSQSKIESTTNTSSPLIAKKTASLKRASSCSALPSNIKPLDRHNPRLAHEEEERVQRCAQPPKNKCVGIEERENAILEECYRNEGLSPECADMGCNYAECHHFTSVSKFPLPDHLNYPLNKYYKSETNLTNRLQPLKKIRSSLRKLKHKTQNIHLSTPDRYDNYSLPVSIDHSLNLETFDSSYFSDFNDSENSDVIMARLAKNPNSKKAWMKKIFKWNIGKSYSAKKKQSRKDNDSIVYSEASPSLKKRSHSTRSIPEALMNIWSKVHETPSATTTATHEFEFTVPTTLQRASSMPSIATHRVAKQQQREVADVIYFNERGTVTTVNNNKNIFANLLNQQQQQRPPHPPQRSLSTPVKDSCDYFEEEEERFRGFQAECIAQENNNRIPPRHPQYYTSCHDVRTLATQHTPVPMHCQCCAHIQHFGAPQPQQQYVYQQQYQHDGQFYRHDVEVVTEEDEYCSGDEMVQPIAYYTTSHDISTPQPTASIIAPLDMKVSVERRAERRKICDMVFDTFV